MTAEGFIETFYDPDVKEYVHAFASSNFGREEDRRGFLKDVWCEVGMLKEEQPSIDLIARVVWRQMIRRVPMLARLAEGYTQKEVAAREGTHQRAISRRSRRFFTKVSKNV